MLAIAARIVRRTRARTLDQLAIWLFFFITRHTSLGMLHCFHRELVAEMHDRLAAKRERQQKPAA